MGESLCVIGDIDELGKWSDFKCHMKWTEGHIWVCDTLVIQDKPQFSYKYVLMKDGQPQQWERGQNRIADLRLVSDSNQEFDLFASFANPNG